MTPVAIMTSAAKDNHQRVGALLAGNNWFGRGEDSFRWACPACWLSQSALHQLVLAAGLV